MIKTDYTYQSSLKFILLIGLVSLFADMTYEGARSIAGPYLALLGANAATVGFVSGIGELVGYAFRGFSGYVADKTKRYWLITFFGYSCNLIAVPLLGFTNQLWLAATLLTTERLGKAIRTPTRDAMLAHSCQQVGLGWGFGLHEALDKTGALLGPLLVALFLYFHYSYHVCFAVLALPALFSLGALVLAFRFNPQAHHESLDTAPFMTASLNVPIFWFYAIGTSLVAAGFADFPLIAFHLQKTKSIQPSWIPLIYAAGMGAGAISSLLFGRLYDKWGFAVLVWLVMGCAGFAPFVFLGNLYWILLGTILWGMGMGAQQSLMRAAIARMVSPSKRASAYGVFNMCYGVAWFLGSFLLGLLYDQSITLLVSCSLILELAALPFLWVVWRKINSSRIPQPQ